MGVEYVGCERDMMECATGSGNVGHSGQQVAFDVVAIKGKQKMTLDEI